MKKIVRSITVLMAVVMGCKSTPLIQSGDKEISIQLKFSDQQYDDQTAVQVRIFNLKKMEDTQKLILNEKMMYGSDSSFYLLQSGRKEFAKGVTPVANGVQNCYEFILIFPGTKNEIKKYPLFYRDIYISGKTYQMSLR